MNTEVPGALRAAYRIRDIMNEAIAFDAPRETARCVVRYVTGFGLRESDLPPGVFYRHRNLRHWASRYGSYPALLGFADDGVNRALLATFLTPMGTLAPVRDPQLLLGAPNGACLRLTRGHGEDDYHLWLTQSLDDAFRLRVRYPDDAVYCAMSFANIGKVTVPRGAARVSIVIRNGSAGARDELRAAIAMQGPEARVLSSDEIFGKANA